MQPNKHVVVYSLVRLISGENWTRQVMFLCLSRRLLRFFYWTLRSVGFGCCWDCSGHALCCVLLVISHALIVNSPLNHTYHPISLLILLPLLLPNCLFFCLHAILLKSTSKYQRNRVRRSQEASFKHITWFIQTLKPAHKELRIPF